MHSTWVLELDRAYSELIRGLLIGMTSSRQRVITFLMMVISMFFTPCIEPLLLLS